MGGGDLGLPAEPAAVFVPRLARSWPADAGQHRRIEASLVMADISGFTPLSERLAALGKRGAEELTVALDEVFSQLLSAAGRFGGSLAAFGGDALLLVFEGADHPVRAAAAAWSMRRELRQIPALVTEVGRTKLRMSVGVHSGEVDLFLVGDLHRQLVLTGPATTLVASAEAAANAGEIVLSAPAVATLPPDLHGEPRGAGMLLASPPRARPERASAPQPAGGADARALLPRTLRDLLSTGAVEPEHRQMSVAFVRVRGVDALLVGGGPEAVAGELHSLVTAIQRSCERAAAQNVSARESSELPVRASHMAQTPWSERGGAAPARSLAMSCVPLHGTVLR